MTGSTESTPPTAHNPDPRSRLMGAVARFIAGHSGKILVAGGVLFVASLWAAQRIQQRTQLKDMMPDDIPAVKAFNDLMERYDTTSMALITVEGPSPEAMIFGAEAFVQEVRRRPELMEQIQYINLRVPRDFVESWGMLLNERQDLERMRTMVSHLNLVPYLTALNDNLEAVYTGDEAEEEIDSRKKERETVDFFNQLEDFATGLWAYLEAASPEDPSVRGDYLAYKLLFGDAYAFDPDRTMLIFSIRPTFATDDVEACAAMVLAFQEIIAAMGPSHPELTFGYSGDVSIQGDEMLTMSNDMFWPSLLALGLILCLFLVSFRQLRAILFSLAVLVAGVVYATGVVGVTLGQVTMITSFFAVVLIGLGIDYGVHLVTNFNGLRVEGLTPEAALTQTLQKCGVGIIMGALTTAIAFYAVALTGSKAIAQLGFVIGSGILCCLAAMVFLLCAALYRWGGARVPAKRRFYLRYNFFASFGGMSRAAAWWVIAGLTLATVAAGWAASHVGFQYDIMALEPPRALSIITSKKISAKLGFAESYAFHTTGDIEEARRVDELLEKQPIIAEVDSIADYVPSPRDQHERLAVIRSIRAQAPRVSDTPLTAEDVTALAEQIQRLEYNVIEIGDLSVAGLGEDNQILAKRDRMIREIFGADTGKPGREVFQRLIAALEADPEKSARRLDALDQPFARRLDELVSRMAAVDRPVTVVDLPETIRTQHVDRSGTQYLATIIPNAGIWREQALREFDRVTREASPEISGTLNITILFLDEIFHESRTAAIWALLVIGLLLVLDFKRLRLAILALVPLGVGTVWMLGALELTGQKLNFMSVLALPLILGIGVDYGIHVIHRYHAEGERNMKRVLAYTGRGIFLSAMTTMFGFGSLGLIAGFPSLASFGTILFFGVTASLVISVTLLPALLIVTTRKKGVKTRSTRGIAAAAVIAALLCPQDATAAEDAAAIMQKVDAKAATSSAISKISMHIYPGATNADDRHDFRVLAYSRGDDDSYMEFLSPRTIKGLRILSKGGDQWVYFPSTGRVRKIAGKSKGHSVKGVGGDFSYEDLGGGKMTDKYTFTLLGEDATAWRIEAKPKDPDSTYTKLVIHVEKASYLTARIEFFTAEDGHAKDLEQSQFKTISGRLVPTRMTMHNRVKNSKTVILVHEAQYDVPVAKRLFNPTRFYQ